MTCTKYGCSVYNEPDKRFQPDGCVISHKFGLKYDPCPGSLKAIDTPKGSFVIYWPPKKCEDGQMRPLGIETCSYIWDQNQGKYEGECNQCGKCCMMGGKNQDSKCKYLIKVED